MKKPVSDKQLAANRANAAQSTGPRSPECKFRSAQETGDRRNVPTPRRRHSCEPKRCPQPDYSPQVAPHPPTSGWP